MDKVEGGLTRRGSGKLRWRYNVKRGLKRTEVNSREWERMAEDHGGWRRLVETSDVAPTTQGTTGEEG